MAATIQHTLEVAATFLAAVDNPRLEAEILLGHCLEKPREYFFTYPTVELSAEQQARFQSLLSRRKIGEPVAYIIGRRAFWDFELKVDPRVLIPRAETELIVECALKLFKDQHGLGAADLGTGSGAIAIALALSFPDWRVQAVDTSADALAVAAENAADLGAGNIEFLQSSWCDDLADASQDLIVANPPYVEPGDKHLQQGDLRFEPIAALQAADAGFADLLHIAEAARRCLRPGGWLLMEHGYDQHETLAGKLLELGYKQLEGRQDLAGHTRMLQAQWCDEKSTGLKV